MHDAYLLSLSLRTKLQKKEEDRECVHVGYIAPAAVDPAQPGDPSIDPLLLNSPARPRPPPRTATFQRFFFFL